VTADDLGASEEAINNATEEETEAEQETGTLIEIGNTTAENTTIIIRTTDDEGNTVDETLEISTDTLIQEGDGSQADLSDWIAGDQITFWAERFKNSGQLVANRIRNHSFKRWHFGKNGWITAIRPDENEMDVEWNNNIFTLDVSEARMVAGLKNPATINDFEVGDRIRARVKEDGDKNPSTWDAEIVVVLRRGKDLFMRVTRWVVLGRIVAMPDDLTLPTTIDVEVLPTKFFEKGDVNNLIGEPGTIIQVDINEDTKLVRRFFGKAMLKEFSEGDQVRIIGRRDENTGHLAARFMKNNNIQRLGVAHRLGKVVSIDEAAKTFAVELIRTRLDNKNFTVATDDETRFFKLGEEISFSDIQVDDVIRVRGTLRRSTRIVDADFVNVVVYHKELVSHIEDLSKGDKVDIDEVRSKIRERISEIKSKRVKGLPALLDLLK